MSFDAHGARRAGDWLPAMFPPVPIETPRGFTGHEHLDGVGLIHMNGRVYDPLLGRFLSADPFVQFPKSTQGLNRYTYTHNNPLSFTDPSGFGIGSFFRSAARVVTKPFRAVGKAVANVVADVAKAAFKAAKKALQSQIGQIIGSIVSGAAGGPLGAAAFSGLVTYANGGSLGDVLTAAGTTLAFAAVTQGIAASFGHEASFLSGAHFGKVLAHGVAGGAFSKLRGGRFQAGFLAGSASAFAAPGIGALGGKDLGGVIGRTAAAAVVGGVSAELGAGKFKNGALAGAFQRLYNDERLFGVPEGDRYPWGRRSEETLNSNRPESEFRRAEEKWWEWARKLSVCGECEAAQFYRGLGYEVYEGTLTVETSLGLRHHDLAFRPRGVANWAFTEVKVNSSPLIPSQVAKDRLIESQGYVGITGPEGMLGPQGPVPVTLVRVKVP